MTINVEDLPLADIAAWLEINPPALPYNALVSTPTVPAENVVSVTAVNAGTLGPAATYTITAPTAGTYILEFGYAGASDPSTSFYKITSNLGGETDYSGGGTAHSGGPALVPSLVLTAGQVITMTVTQISGSSSVALNGCWAKLTRVS